MSQTFVYLPNDFATVPTHQVGTYAKELSVLKELDIPLPKAIVIPRDTLKIIAQANNLQAKVYKLLQETNYSSSISKEKASEKLTHLILRQTIPKELARELLRIYHDYFQDSFILVKNSEYVPTQDIELHNIHSDTNFIAAVLEVWAKIAIRKLKKLLLGTNNSHEILFPSPILVQEQLEPQVSGVAYSFDFSDGNKNRVTVVSTWGVYHPKQQELDRYCVDIRTGNITHKQIQTKQSQLRRVLGKLRTDDVLVKNQNRETLTQKQLTHISALVSTVKRKYLSQIEVLWAIQNNTVYIESIKETDIALQVYSNQPKSLLKLYATGLSFATTPEQAENIDGIAIYNSGTLLSATATHPNEVVKTKQKKHLIEAIAKVLQKQISKFQKPLLYRANNFTSNEFNKLKFASVYEVAEANPYIGFRGGLRYTSQPEAFRLELSALSEVLKKTQKQLTLILPFVRSADELAQLIQLIKKQGLTEYPHFSIWLELSTPENVFNLSEYPIQQIQGLVFNIHSIHALITGVDPHNPDIASRYSKNPLLLKKLVEHALKTSKESLKTQSITRQPEFFVDLTVYDKELMEQLCDLQITGFIMNEQVTEFAKKCIIERQHNTIL